MFTEVTNVWESDRLSPEEALTLQIKAQVMIELRQIIFSNGWNQAEAAKRLGITQPRVSYLVNGQVSKFTTDKLLGYISKLGYDFSLNVTKGQPQIETKQVA